MPLKVAAAQTALRKKSYDQAIEDAQKLIHAASKQGAQIVCLPEHWLLEHRDQAKDATDRMMRAAKSERIFLITGANYLQTNSGVRIRSTLIDPEGHTVGWQDKVHLFLEERNVAVAGREYALLETALGRVGITICYDNVFPEAARSLALRGADMLFVPSRITLEGLDPWLLYLKTRALENRIPIIAPNIFAPPKYPGGSAIIDLKQPTHSNPVILPEIIASAGAGEKVIVAEINIDQARQLRLKRLTERIPEAYG